MKKWLFLALLLYPLSLKAEIARSSKEEPVMVRYNIENVAASTDVVLIKLSSSVPAGTFNPWPHIYTGGINIFDIYVGLDKPATSSGTIKLGVLTTVNSATGTVSWFFETSFDGSAALTERERTSLDMWAYRTKVDKNGNTPYILTSSKTIASTIFQNDTALPTPTVSDVIPSVGDIILELINNGPSVGTPDLSIEVKYNSEP